MLFRSRFSCALRLVCVFDESVQGLVEVFGVTPACDRDQGKQTRVCGRLLPVDSIEKTARLRQGVVKNVRQTVAMGDQALDGIEPDAGPSGAAGT